jgi:hypothetical protein
MAKKTHDDDDYKVDADKVRAKLKETEGDRRWWKPKPNTKNIIRVLPPWGKGSNGSFFFSAGLHYNFQIGGQNRGIPCLKTREVPDRCLICEFIEALRNSDNEDHKKLVSGSKGIRKKVKYWINIIDRKNPEEVKMYGGSRKMIEVLQSAIDDDDYGDITDPEEGYDVRVNRVGSTFTDTQYTFTVRPKPSPLGIPDWKQKIHKLDQEVIEWMSVPEIAKVLRANYSDEMAEVGFKVIVPGEKKKVVREPDDEEDDEEEKPKKKATKIKSKKKDDDEDEDEDEDEPEEDEDEEEEESDEDEEEEEDED